MFALRTQRTRLLGTAAVAGIAALMFLLALTPGISFTEDLGRHLLLGRIICEQRAVPKTNLLTYTHADYPFVNHHWLSEVFFYQVHRAIGLNGMILLKAALMTAALLAALLAAPPRRGWPIYWVAGILSAVILAYRAHVRPEIFSFLGVGLYLYCIERIRGGARWPRAVMLAYGWFWANAHIYFLFGIGMAGAFVLERWMNDPSRRARLRELAWLATFFALAALNPNGIRGLLYPLRIFANYGMEITENASPLQYWRTVVNPMLLALPWLSLIALASLATCRRGGRQASANAIIATAALLLSWTMARNTPLLALAALPLLGICLGSRVTDDRPQPAMRWGLLVALLPLILNVWLVAKVVDGSYHRVFPSPIAPTPFGLDREERYLAIRELKARGLRGPVFSDYNIGSLVEYNLHPEFGGYVDNRPEAFPASFWRAEYLPALGLGAVWEQVAGKRGINSIIVSLTGVKESYVRELLRRPEWVLVHFDFLCAAWLRDTEQNRDAIAMNRVDDSSIASFEKDLSDRIDRLPRESLARRHVEADRIVYELYALVCLDEAPRAWPHIWRLHELYPDYQVVHELMRVSAPPEQVEAVKEVLARRARWPVAAKQVLDWGRVLESEGRMQEALSVYARGRWFFPLSPQLREAIEQIRDRAYRAAVWGT
ncbi:MAG: hypothetical protein BWY59_00907 [Verrucomicrobia bacterium ADurb.Bin345]|nr:MAG: hypothetical protein BWY59_00907 [Verrucomicrobia bacterium ADurb.Bin345]